MITCTHHNVEDDDAVALGRNHHARGGWKRVRGRAQLRDERVPWLERVSGRRSDSDSLVLLVVVVVVFDEHDDGASVCMRMRACVVCPRCSSLDYQLTGGWLRAARLSALSALCSSARPPCLLLLLLLLPPIYPSSLLKGFSFLFAAHRRAYTRYV
jgi:hypothetical protein